jgi:hypothetical protein
MEFWKLNFPSLVLIFCSSVEGQVDFFELGNSIRTLESLFSFYNCEFVFF